MLTKTLALIKPLSLQCCTLMTELTPQNVLNLNWGVFYGFDHDFFPLSTAQKKSVYDWMFQLPNRVSSVEDLEALATAFLSQQSVRSSSKKSRISPSDYNKVWMQFIDILGFTLGKVSLDAVVKKIMCRHFDVETQGNNGSYMFKTNVKDDLLDILTQPLDFLARRMPERLKPPFMKVSPQDIGFNFDTFSSCFTKGQFNIVPVLGILSSRDMIDLLHRNCIPFTLPISVNQPGKTIDQRYSPFEVHERTCSPTSFLVHELYHVFLRYSFAMAYGDAFFKSIASEAGLTLDLQYKPAKVPLDYAWNGFCRAMSIALYDFEVQSVFLDDSKPLDVYNGHPRSELSFLVGTALGTAGLEYFENSGPFFNMSHFKLFLDTFLKAHPNQLDTTAFENGFGFALSKQSNSASEGGYIMAQRMNNVLRSVVGALP